jgi:[ribosomal protein S5]-alanine N-acetyltransferase
MNPIPTLRTPRLTLRPFTPEDARPLYHIYQHAGVLQYFPNPTPPPLEKVERFIAAQQAHWETYGYGNWAICLPDLAELAGWAGLQFIPETGETEVGYLLDRPYWGQGYATEAALAALQFGFEHLPCGEIIALVHPENAGSLKVAAKCGLAVVERKVYWGLELVRHTLGRGAPIDHPKDLSGH